MQYLYTLKDCGGCEVARSLLKGQEFIEVPIDNPITELGIQVLFRDGLVHAPVLVDTERGIYFMVKNEWLRIKRLGVKDNA